MSIPAIVREACRETKSHRYDLSTPFPWGDWIYGTDGKIMVRCPIRCDLDLKLADGRKVPDPTRVFVPGAERITVALPEADETKLCHWCNGTGITDRYQCDDCGNSQRVMVKGKAITFDCPDCDGKGKVPNHEPVRVSDSPRYYLAACYIALLRRHGVRYIGVPVATPSGKMDDPAACSTFSGLGFEGWLMPLDAKRIEEDMAREGKLNLATKGA